MVNFFTDCLDRLGNWNPQLYREMKGRLSQSRIRLILLASALCQAVILFFIGAGIPVLDPEMEEQYDRYCLGPLPDSEYANGLFLCTQDLSGQLAINWRLWWLDCFTFLSMASIVILLVAGVYLLIADSQKECQQGTLNFVRLSPQSETNFIWGKILGVPSLLYGFLLTLLPLHLIAAMGAGISLTMLVGYYAVVAVGAVFFFHIALWIGLSGNSKNYSISQSAAIAGLLAVVLMIFTFTTLRDTDWEPFFLSWFTFLYPGKALVYLAQSTFLPTSTVGYLGPNELDHLRWYGGNLFKFAPLGMAFMAFNYGVGIYWSHQVLRRRFRRPLSTAWSKRQSVGVTLSLVAIANGFLFQDYEVHDYQDFLLLNLGSWQLTLCLFFLGLTLALSPQLGYLRDWSRYRHESPREHRTWGWQALITENSPAQWVIAFNLLLTGLLTLPMVLLVPIFHPVTVRDDLPLGSILVAIVMGLLWSFTFATLLQWGTARIPIPRPLVLVLAVVIMAVLPWAIAIGSSANSPSVMWFSPMPVVAMAEGSSFVSPLFFLSMLTQTLVIGTGTWQFNRYLQRLGRSESQHYLLDKDKTKALS